MHICRLEDTFDVDDLLVLRRALDACSEPGAARIRRGVTAAIRGLGESNAVGSRGDQVKQAGSS